jgi:hypothetical protein
MEFALGVILFLLGSGVIALCVFAVPGPRQAGGPGAAPPDHLPGGH